MTPTSLQSANPIKQMLVGEGARDRWATNQDFGKEHGPFEERDLVKSIELAIGHPCILVNTANGNIERVSQEWPQVDVFRWLGMYEQVARMERPEVIEDHAPLLLLAIPVKETHDSTDCIALALIVTDQVNSIDDVKSAAKAFGIQPKKLFTWASSQTVCPTNIAIRLVESLFENDHLNRRAELDKQQLDSVSERLIATFEELNLLYQLTDQISLDRSVCELCEEVVDWLSEVMPASCFLARLITCEDGEENPGNIENGEPCTIVAGKLPFEINEVDLFYDCLGNDATQRAVVLDSKVTSSPIWRYPTIHEVVCVPIRTRERQVGWIAAINQDPKDSLKPGKLGTIHSSLLTSVCSILGVHAGNRTLLHRKEHLLDSAVRSITTAIDAKDSYTCGHSDRVARIAVRLARQLGYSEEDQKTLYLGGLLHDVGKIGIDDDILSKPDGLTPEEYNHIKQHPEFGARIIEEVEELKHVIPIILHHHEAWNGSGYPAGLRGEECPAHARIMAVADAFDAMSSDRPYRKGMPFGKIETIFRTGAGKQWDAKVIDAYFEAKEDILAIAQDGLLEECLNG